MVIEGATADTVGHYMTFVTKFFKLLLVVMVHTEVEAQCFVGIRDMRELDGCFLSRGLLEGETAG